MHNIYIYILIYIGIYWISFDLVVPSENDIQLRRPGLKKSSASAQSTIIWLVDLLAF